MNSIVAIVFFAALAAANAGLATYYSAPVAAYHPNLIASPYAAYPSAPLSTEIVGAAASENTLIAGPSGTISTTKNVAGPAVATRYAAPAYVAPAYTSYAAPAYVSRYASALPYAYAHYGGLYL